MRNILIRGGTVITPGMDIHVLPGADVAITGDTIAFVGAAPPGFRPDEIIEARSHLVLPGLCNAHTHSGTVLSRGLSGHQAPEPWFDLSVTRDGQPPVPSLAEPPMTGDDAYWAALLAAVELIRGGVVTFADQYFHMEEVARAVLESGLRANLAWCSFGAEAGEIGADIAGVAAWTELWRGAGGGRITTSFGPHSAYACSPLFLARTAAVAVRLGIGIRLRASESQEQLDFSLLAFDMTPIQVLDKNGLLDVPAVLVNASCFGEHDLPILAARKPCVVVCPLAQSAAGIPPAPVNRLLDAGVPVALGTDSAGLSGSLDMFGVMRETWRVLGGTPKAAELAFRLATEGGSAALGFPTCGRLAPGYGADLILVDTRRPHLTPLNDPLLTAVTAVTTGDISDVMVAGQWLMRSGRLTTLDEPYILREATNRARKPSR